MRAGPAGAMSRVPSPTPNVRTGHGPNMRLQRVHGTTAERRRAPHCHMKRAFWRTGTHGDRRQISGCGAALAAAAS
eukprot:3048460-Prymnesium_polylepis.1